MNRSNRSASSTALERAASLRGSFRSANARGARSRRTLPRVSIDPAPLMDRSSLDGECHFVVELPCSWLEVIILSLGCEESKIGSTGRRRQPACAPLVRTFVDSLRQGCLASREARKAQLALARP